MSNFEDAKQSVANFVRNHGGDVENVSGKETKFSITFRVFQNLFTLRYAARDSYLLEHQLGDGAVANVWKSLHPFDLDLEQPEEFVAYRKGLPKFDDSQSFLRYLLDNLEAYSKQA